MHAFIFQFLVTSLFSRKRHLSNLAVKSGKKSPGQETGLENRGRLKVLNDTKLALNEHE
jgi:hypothetical protein